MASGRFQRSEDGGQTWEDIDPETARHRLEGSFYDVDQIVAAMINDGFVVRTMFAHYRFLPQP